MRSVAIAIVLSGMCGVGCGAVIEPGHRGLLFSPRHGGLQHDVLGPGYHRVGVYGRIDDFDVTYSTRHEVLHTVSSEGAQLDLKVALIYRPIVSEIYDLDVEIGPNFYEEVVGPEFKTATRGVFARHSYLGLQQNNEKIENEIEDEVKRRIAGKHVEVSSVTMEEIVGSPEIVNVVQSRLVAEQDSARKKVLLEAEGRQQEQQLENQAKRQKREQENEFERAKHLAEAELLKKQHEHQMAQEQAAIDKVNTEAEAETRIIKAKADAQAIMVLAKAKAEEKKAEAATVTPLQVMMHGYDALAKLGGENTAFIFGDWSKVPNFLFPQTPAFNSLFHGGGGGTGQTPVARASTR